MDGLTDRPSHQQKDKQTQESLSERSLTDRGTRVITKEASQLKAGSKRNSHKNDIKSWNSISLTALDTLVITPDTATKRITSCWIDSDGSVHITLRNAVCIMRTCLQLTFIRSSVCTQCRLYRKIRIMQLNLWDGHSTRRTLLINSFWCRDLKFFT